MTPQIRHPGDTSYFEPYDEVPSSMYARNCENMFEQEFVEF